MSKSLQFMYFTVMSGVQVLIDCFILTCSLTAITIFAFDEKFLVQNESRDTIKDASKRMSQF